jgi:hypothetical protein
MTEPRNSPYRAILERLAGQMDVAAAMTGEARSIHVATTVPEDVRRVTTQLCGREPGDGRHTAAPWMWGGA